MSAKEEILQALTENNIPLLHNEPVADLISQYTTFFHQSEKDVCCVPHRNHVYSYFNMFISPKQALLFSKMKTLFHVFDGCRHQVCYFCVHEHNQYTDYEDMVCLLCHTMPTSNQNKLKTKQEESMTEEEQEMLALQKTLNVLRISAGLPRTIVYRGENNNATQTFSIFH